MEVRWSEQARASARQYMRDQDGLSAVGIAIAALHDDPFPAPPDGFHCGDYHRLHVGPYRVHYVIDGDVIMIERVDKVPGQ